MIEFYTDQFAAWLRANGVRSALILAAAWLAYRALQAGMTRLARTLEGKGGGTPQDQHGRAVTLVAVFHSAGAIVIIVIAGLMVLAEFGVDITPLIAGAGVVGLAIGLGAQTFVRDLIGGLFILLEDQFHLGDTVAVGGVTGSVERITLRKTHLRDLDGTLHLVPNGEIRVVSNRTSGWSRSVVDVTVSYEQDIGKAITALQSVARDTSEDAEVKSKLLEPLSVTGVEGLDTQALRLRIIGKTAPGQQWAVNRILRQRIKEKFEEDKIVILAPQAVVIRDSRDSRDEADGGTTRD